MTTDSTTTAQRAASSSSTRRITVNGVTLHAEVREPGAGGRGDLTVLLLHGFTGSAAGWGSHLDTLASAGLRVIALDLLGHGGSDAPPTPARYSIERCRDDILAALPLLGAEPGETVLLGYSMGGRIALYTALAGVFRALILESASPGLATAAERAERRAADEALAASIERDGLPAFVAHWEAQPLFASQRDLPPQTQAALRAQRLANGAEGLARSLRGVGTGAQPSLHGQLATLTLPTLVIAGARDAKFAAIAGQMAAAIPHARLALVADAGHTVHLEQPKRFDALVTDFCAQLPPNTGEDLEATTTP